MRSKNILREKVLQLLRNQSQEDRLKKSWVIADKLFSMREFVEAKMILFYASFDGEVETFEMMKQAQRLGKKIALPASIKIQKKIIPTLIENLDEDLQIGVYGIKEPRDVQSKSVDFRQIDLIIVPGVAFDRENNRLGRGEGYYDRFLRDIPAYTPAFGLAFDFQIVNRLPYIDAHDMKLSRVIVN